MNTKEVNLLANVIAPLAVVVVTIVLFFLFMPAEPDTLFWFNMAYSVLLEVILFGYIGWLPDSGQSVVLKWMCGYFSVLYICVALVWMLLFSLALSQYWPLKVYFAVIAVLTVLWIFIGASTVKVDHIAETSKASLTSNRQAVDRVAGNASMLLEQFNLLRAAHPELTEAAPSVTSLCRGISTLSPTAMADEGAAKRVKNIISGLEELLSNPVSDNSGAQLKSYADNSIIMLNNIKKSIRK